MNVNFLRKFFMLVLLVVGCAGGAWADDDSSTAVAELINSNGETVGTYNDVMIALNNISEDGMTLKMLKKDVYTGHIDISNGKAFTFDLNGNYFSTTGNVTLSSASKMTIVDKSGNGQLYVDSRDYRLVVGQDCELNIVGGNYEFYQPIDVKANATLNICDGYFKVNFFSTTHYVIEDDYVGENAKINIYGGHYQRVNESMKNKLAQNYIVNDNSSTENTYKYSVSPNEKQLIQITKSNGVIVGTYANTQSAIDAITEDGLTLKIVKDIDGPKEGTTFVFTNGKSVTLDLNGHTLDYRYWSTTIISVGSKLKPELTNKLTIVDNSTGNGTVLFNGYSDIDARYGSEINIKGGTYVLGGGFIATISGGRVNIYAGNFKNSDGLTQGSYGDGITIYGGCFYKSEASMQKCVADGYGVYKKTNDGTTDEYKYYVDTYVTELTYGNGTIDIQKEISDKLIIDLKDEGDLSTSLSKIRVGNEIENVNVTVKKNFANTNWHAFYVPFDINVSEDLLQNFEIAKIWDTELNLDDNSTTIEFIKLKDGESISAFTPCLIKANATGKQDITFPNVTVYKNQTKSIDCSNVDETFTFTGVMENTSINGCYALKSETNSLVLANSANAQVTPLKFYMTVESKTPATSIKSKKFAVRVIGDETTGISDINAGGTDAKAANATVYNVQGAAVGTSLNGLPAGLYIQNGRKVVVK